jgi:hypothetical protein
MRKRIITVQRHRDGFNTHRVCREDFPVTADFHDVQLFPESETNACRMYIERPQAVPSPLGRRSG